MKVTFIKIQKLGGYRKMKISITNSKLGGKIPSINLPPLITCIKDAPCSKLCYARKGNWTYDNVKKSHRQNLEHFQNNSSDYFQNIISWLNDDDVTFKFFRWHSSGDIVNIQYLLGMVKVARECPQTKFLAFTKKFDLINSYLSIYNSFPTNLKVVFSAWDKNFEVENPYNLPVTYVAFKNENLNPQIPEFAIPCIGKCSECKSCWSLEKGQSVVFHQH
jgi:hypothetical protein